MTGDLAERPPRSFAFGPFVLIPERQLLLKDEAPVRIGSRALDILTALVERSGELVSKRELISRAWPDTVVEESNLKVNMVALRRALGDGRGAAQYIATVTGRGYRFIAPVQSNRIGRRSNGRRPQRQQAADSLPTGTRASSAGRMRSTPFDAIWMSRGSCRLSAPVASAKRRSRSRRPMRRPGSAPTVPRSSTWRRSATRSSCRQRSPRRSALV